MATDTARSLNGTVNKSEWVVILAVIGIMAALTLNNIFNGKELDPSTIVPRRGIEVFVKGAVKHPGLYRIPHPITVNEILTIAEVENEADLRRFKPAVIIEKNRSLNIPKREMITIYLEGRVFNKGAVTIPKGTTLQELAEKIEWLEGADKQPFLKKRKIKNGEIFTVF